MAISLEFIDFVIPVALIKEKYPGGWEQCLNDHKQSIGKTIWYDEHLFRMGAMNPNDIGFLASKWKERGFEPFETESGKKICKDACVLESLLRTIAFPCGWIDFVPDQRAAYLKGTEPGKIVSREDFS